MVTYFCRHNLFYAIVSQLILSGLTQVCLYVFVGILTQLCYIFRQFFAIVRHNTKNTSYNDFFYNYKMS
jgi:hypothetical protein